MLIHRLEIKIEEDGGSVVVRDVRLSDCGSIKCVATNILGRATSVANLSIEGEKLFDKNMIKNIFMFQPHQGWRFLRSTMMV